MMIPTLLHLGLALVLYPSRGRIDEDDNAGKLGELGSTIMWRLSPAF
jgi:hypothetical protein